MAKESDINESQDDAKSYLAKQTVLLYASSTEELSGRFADGFVLLASAVTTLSSINELALQDARYSSEILMLSRAALEKMTNFMYSTVCSSEEHERFLLYPYYRAYHNLNREKYSHESKLNIRYNQPSSIAQIPQYKKALELFSDKNSRLKWSLECTSLDEKLSYIAKKTKQPSFVFLLNSLLIYSEASEALHGNMYGAVSMLGVYEPPFSINGKEADRKIKDKLTMIYFSLGEMVHLLVEWIQREHGTNIKLSAHLKRSHDARKDVYTSLKSSLA